MELFTLPRDRSARIALVLLIHAALLWGAFKMQRLPYFHAAGGDDPAMVWVKEPVAVLTTTRDKTEPARRPDSAGAAASAPLLAPVVEVKLAERIVLHDAVNSTLSQPPQTAQADPAQEKLAAAAAGGVAGSGRGTANGSLPSASPMPSRPSAIDEDKSILYSVLSPVAAEYTIPALTGDQVHAVDRGFHKTIEIAIAQHIIRQIRARYPDQIQWQSMRTGAMVRLSMQAADNDRVVEYLHYDLFGYKPL